MFTTKTGSLWTPLSLIWWTGQSERQNCTNAQFAKFKRQGLFIAGLNVPGWVELPKASKGGKGSEKKRKQGKSKNQVKNALFIPATKKQSDLNIAPQSAAQSPGVRNWQLLTKDKNNENQKTSSSGSFKRQS